MIRLSRGPSVGLDPPGGYDPHSNPPADTSTVQVSSASKVDTWPTPWSSRGSRGGVGSSVHPPARRSALHRMAEPSPVMNVSLLRCQLRDAAMSVSGIGGQG